MRLRRHDVRRDSPERARPEDSPPAPVERRAAPPEPPEPELATAAERAAARRRLDRLADRF